MKFIKAKPSRNFGRISLFLTQVDYFKNTYKLPRNYSKVNLQSMMDETLPILPFIKNICM